MFNQLPSYVQLILGIAGIVGIILGGFFVFLNLFDKARKSREDEAEQLDSRLITGFKQEMELQRGVITRMEGELKEIRDNNLKLVSENKTLREILQGRDSATMESIKKIELIHQSTEATNKNIERLASSIESLVKRDTELEVRSTVTSHPKGASHD